MTERIDSATTDIATGLVEAWAASRLTQPTPAERDFARYLVDLLGIEAGTSPSNIDLEAAIFCHPAGGESA